MNTLCGAGHHRYRGPFLVSGDVVVVDNLLGMSLMKTRNRTGPRCEPCGTPAVMLCSFDWVLPTVTVIVRVER